MAKVTSLGAAKPDSEVFKRGYTINLNPTGKPAGKPAEKAPEKEVK
jgi:hypothetical protein